MLGVAGSVAALVLFTAKTMMTVPAPAPEIMARITGLSQSPSEYYYPVFPASFASENPAGSVTMAPILLPPNLTNRDGLNEVLQDSALPVWEALVNDGDTLDQLLARAELAGPLRAEIAFAIAAEYDLRKLRPGHQLRVEYRSNGSVSLVVLAVDDGEQIEVTFDGQTAARTVPPVLTTLEQADQLIINGSIYASLNAAGVPTSFAVQLADSLGDTVDFRRSLRGGESLNIKWEQSVLADGSKVGHPKIIYASLDLGSEVFEIIWPENGAVHASLFLNGEVLRSIAPPVEGARLSSVFGKRKHPIYGNVRMHTGIDYAAPKGTPITATAPGRVSFIGWRNGYGRVVEISHGASTMTRYAHLSAVPKTLKIGNRVLAGEVIGQVGETGTATAPNLHYEVRVNGRPIDPLGKDVIASVESSDTASKVALLERTRALFRTTLNNQIKL